MQIRKRQLIISLLSIFFVLAIWQLIVWIVFYNRGVNFPTPINTFKQFAQNLAGENIYDVTIWKHTISSISRWLAGYLVAVITGIILGFLLGSNQLLNKLFMPFISVLQLIPGLAWIPIALLLFGLGVVSTIFMIFIIAFTPIVITTATGIKNTPADLIHAAQIMGANRIKVFIHVLLPSALFNIIDGMRIGLANSWRVLIAAEMIVGNGIGLGYIIIQSRWTLDYLSAFVAIIMIVIVGLTFEKFIFQVIENKLRLKYGHELSSETLKYE